MLLILGGISIIALTGSGLFKKPQEAKEKSENAQSEETNKMNIYDFAGNESEWTLERTFLTDVPCACRGGSYIGSGSGYPASDRNIGSISSRSYQITFLSTLY